MDQTIELVETVYSRGDGYFEKPFNKTHSALSKIKTITIEDLIERAIKK